MKLWESFIGKLLTEFEGVTITARHCIQSSYHSVLLVLDGGDELAELLERSGDDELVVRLPRAYAIELEVHQALREAALRLRQGCKMEK